MPSMFKSTVLGFGLLVGAAAIAHAQSVSALPPNGDGSGAGCYDVPIFLDQDRSEPWRRLDVAGGTLSASGRL